MGMRLRFSIRDLLWLTFLVAMALAWSIDRHRLSKELKLERAVLKQAHDRISSLESNEAMMQRGLKILQEKLATAQKASKTTK
jgi:hypothetical protein